MLFSASLMMGCKTTYVYVSHHEYEVTKTKESFFILNHHDLGEGDYVVTICNKKHGKIYNLYSNDLINYYYSNDSVQISIDHSKLEYSYKSNKRSYTSPIKKIQPTYYGSSKI